jgi:hypothetical protein
MATRPGVVRQMNSSRTFAGPAFCATLTSNRPNAA